MNRISWKNQLLFSKGIIVEKIPPITKAKKRFTQYTIPGRNGVLNVDEGTYEPFALTLECHFRDDNADIDELKSFFDGYGSLSLDGERYYEGILNNNIPFESIQNFKKFTLPFMLNPIAKSIETFSETVDVSEATNYIDVGGNYKTYPTLTINAVGNVTIKINEITFSINNANGEYVLDCENKEIISNNQSMSRYMNGEFPILNPGSNEIFISGIGSVNSLVIDYQESYL